MRTVINVLCAIFATATIAPAAPRLLLETTATGPNDIGGQEILTAPPFVVESGKQGEVSIGKLLKYTVTPTVRADGTLFLDIHLIHARNGDAKIAAPRIKTQLGYLAPACAGQWQFVTKATLAK